MLTIEDSLGLLYKQYLVSAICPTHPSNAIVRAESARAYSGIGQEEVRPVFFFTFIGEMSVERGRGGEVSRQTKIVHVIYLYILQGERRGEFWPFLRLICSITYIFLPPWEGVISPSAPPPPWVRARSRPSPTHPAADPDERSSGSNPKSRAKQSFAFSPPIVNSEEISLLRSHRTTLSHFVRGTALP